MTVTSPQLTSFNLNFCVKYVKMLSAATRRKHCRSFWVVIFSIFNLDNKPFVFQVLIAYMHYRLQLMWYSNEDGRRRHNRILTITKVLANAILFSLFAPEIQRLFLGLFRREVAIFLQK